MNNTNSGDFNLLLNHTLSDKRYVKVDLFNAPLEWQLIYSYMNNQSIYGAQQLHTQSYHEVIIHLRSKRRFLVKDTLYEAGLGDLLIFPAGVPHKGIDVRRAQYERCYIYINPELISHLPDGEVISRCFSDTSPNLIHPKEELRDELIHDVYKLNHGSSDGFVDDLFGLRVFIMRLLYIISQNQDQPRVGSSPPPLLRAMMNYIADESSSIQTSASVAEHFGVSESYMSRLFRDSLQISPYQYIQSIRLIEAKRLLHEGQSVTDACFGAGFSDCSHFIAYFRKCVGVTPNEYKNSPRG